MSTVVIVEVPTKVTVSDDGINLTITEGRAAVIIQETGLVGAKGDQGERGIAGTTGLDGATGPAGVGVPTGGTTGQVLAKTSNADYATGWVAAATGGGGGDLLSNLVASEISITGATTATISRMHVCSGTTSSYTVTLPAASGNAGKLIGFRMSPALTRLVTLDGNGSEEIDGTTTRIMWAKEVAILLCDGSNWVKLAGKSIPMSCVMRITSAQSIGSASIIPILLNAIDIDNTGLMGNSGNNRIYILRPGNYNVLGSIVFEGLTVNAPRARSEVYKDNGQIFGGEGSGLATGYPTVLAIAPAVSLLAGSFLDLRAYQNTGVSQNVYGTGSNDSCFLRVIEVISW